MEMSNNGVVDIDIYKSTLLKKNKPQDIVKQIFSDYHLLVEKIFSEYDGEIWHRMGDGAICIFLSPIKAVEACIQLLEKLVAFNKQNENNLSSSPLFTRIGIHEIDSNVIANIPKEERGKFAHSDLDIAGKLQKNCPIGKISISVEVYKKLGVRQRLFRSALTEIYGKRFFVLIDRMITSQEEKLLIGLTEKQKLKLPPIPFLSWDRIVPDEGLNLRTLDKFFERPLAIVIGETYQDSRQLQLNSPISSAATSDTVGIAEVLATSKANPDVKVGIDYWEDTADIVSDRNIIVVGSGTVNIYAFALNDLFQPVRFVKSQSRVLDQIVAASNKGVVYFGSHALPPKDSGLIVVSKSPFNPDKALLWVAGITGIGTSVATEFLKDVITDPNGTLRRKIGVPDSVHPIACVVGAEVRIPSEDWKVSDYYKRWRITDYKVLWMVDRNGSKIL